MLGQLPVALQEPWVHRLALQARFCDATTPLLGRRGIIESIELHSFKLDLTMHWNGYRSLTDVTAIIPDLWKLFKRISTILVYHFVIDHQRPTP